MYDSQQSKEIASVKNQLAQAKAVAAASKERPGSIYTKDGVQYRPIYNDETGKLIRTDEIGKDGNIGAGSWFQGPNGELEFFENSAGKAKTGWMRPTDQATAAMNAQLKDLRIDERLSKLDSWINDGTASFEENKRYVNEFNKYSKDERYVPIHEPGILGGELKWKKIMRSSGDGGASDAVPELGGLKASDYAGRTINNGAYKSDGTNWIKVK